MVFDKEEYKKTKSRIDLLNCKLQVIEQAKQKVDREITEIESNCFHDLVLFYGITPNKIEDLMVGKCLICGKQLFIGVSQYQNLNQENVLDITDTISEETRNHYRRDRNSCVEIAEDVLYDLDSSEEDYSIEECKERILNALKEFDLDNQRHRENIKEESKVKNAIRKRLL